MTEALHHVAAFSPQRPKTAQSLHAHSNQNQNPSRGAGPSTYAYQRSNSSPPKTTFNDKENQNDTPTLKPRFKRTVIEQPEVMVQPPTPSTAGSKFTKMARGLARDIEAEQRTIWGTAIRHGNDNGDVLAQSTLRERKAKPRGEERNTFNDIGNSLGAGVRERKATPRAPKVHLPDVTGLTSAVASPAKNGLDYYVYEGCEEPQEAEGKFLSVPSIHDVTKSL